MAEMLLINLPLAKLSTTPFYVMPPGLLSIAAYLREHDVSVEILDLNTIRRYNPNASLIDTVIKSTKNPDVLVVGFSVMVAGQFGTAKLLCDEIKNISPNIVTVVGGAHVSQFPKEILEKCPSIDYVVMGEGEKQALACFTVTRNKHIPKDWPDGIAFREKTTGVIRILKKEFHFNNVDDLPWPAYDLVDFKDYLHDTSTWHNPYQIDLSLRVPIITSRGCPNICNFCSVAECMGLKYRAMSATNVADMIQMLYEKHGAHYFAIFDANFAQDTQRVIDICNEISSRQLKIVLDLPTGLPINATAEEMIDALASIGLIRTCISIETGDEYIRNKIMRKQVEQESVYLVIQAIRQHPQIFLLADFVIGMPEDTEQSLAASCSLIEQLDIDDIALSNATPYPGTKLFDQCKRDKLFVQNVDTDNLYNATWYSHANLSQFIIRPYRLNMDRLYYYRDKILTMRKSKISAYKKRMEQFISK